MSASLESLTLNIYSPLYTSSASDLEVPGEIIGKGIKNDEGSHLEKLHLHGLSFLVSYSLN